MGNRKQPFGYKMALGEIVIQESEAKLVQEVFRRYIAGESLNELTEALRQQDIPYDEGRLWNKNMVARILADTRYAGEKGHPKLIDEEQLIAANEKRSNKPQLPKKTEAQKVLRRLCGTPPSERVEQSVTDLLNGLANHPDRIQHQRSPTPATYDRLLSAQCAPDAGFLAVVQRHAGTAWRSASLELDTERCDHGGRAARRGALLVHPAGYSTESIQGGASANDRGFCVFGKCSRRKGRCVV